MDIDDLQVYFELDIGILIVPLRYSDHECATQSVKFRAGGLPGRTKKRIILEYGTGRRRCK